MPDLSGSRKPESYMDGNRVYQDLAKFNAGFLLLGPCCRFVDLPQA